MIAGVYRGSGKFEIEEMELRELKDNEVLIDVAACMICATDVHIVADEQPSNPPVILGHEFAGVVAGIGRLVTNVSVGDRVSVEPHDAYCQKCRYCRTGRFHMCLNKIAFGVHKDGGFAEYAIIPDFSVYRIPDGMPIEQGALAENIGCCIHGLDRIDMQYGDSVLILGGGFVGIVMSQLSKLRGCGKLIVSEPKKERRELLLRNGADVVVDPVSEDLMSVVMEHTGSQGADIVIDAAGILATAKIAHTFAARAGKVMYYGLVAPGLKIEIEPNEMFRKELTLMGSVINPNCHHKALEMMNLLNLDGCVTHRFKLKDMKEGLDVARRGESIKVCIEP